jgi:putative thioredoxin
MAESPFIIEVTRENYQQAMEASFKVPLLLDFWAGWCQPCQVLMPVLAKLAEEYEGKFLLGKLNTEEEQEIAAQFGIRSIPTVKLFRDGQPVDEFMGALPEQAIREFLDRHVANESDAIVEEAREHLLAGNTAAAEAALDSLPADKQDKPEVVTLRSHLFFESQVAGTPAATELEARLAADPNDHEALYQLALRKVVNEDYEEAMELLLQLMQKDRSYEDDAGRRGLVKVFALLGNDPLVKRYRSRMASLLY